MLLRQQCTWPISLGSDLDCALLDPFSNDLALAINMPLEKPTWLLFHQAFLVSNSDTTKFMLSCCIIEAHDQIIAWVKHQVMASFSSSWIMISASIDWLINALKRYRWSYNEVPWCILKVCHYLWRKIIFSINHSSYMLCNFSHNPLAMVSKKHQTEWLIKCQMKKNDCHRPVPLGELYNHHHSTFLLFALKHQHSLQL